MEENAAEIKTLIFLDCSAKTLVRAAK